MINTEAFIRNVDDSPSVWLCENCHKMNPPWKRVCDCGLGGRPGHGCLALLRRQLKPLLEERRRILER